MVQFACTQSLLMLSIAQHFFNNQIRFIRFFLYEMNALIVALPTITKQQTKVPDTSGWTPLIYCFYCLVPDFFRILILSWLSALSRMALSNSTCNLLLLNSSRNCLTSAGSKSVEFLSEINFGFLPGIFFP